MTFPIWTYIGHGVTGGEGDNLFYVWQLWWVKHSLLDLHISPFFNPFVYYPGGYEVARGELTPANTLLFLPITAIWGPVVSYNICIIFSFFASAVCAFLWVERLTSRRVAALVAGVVFAFLPYRYAHLPGHLELMPTQWIPWTLFTLECFIASQQKRWAMAAGIGLAMITWSSWYYAYSALLMLPIYVLFRTRPWREHWRQRNWWLGLVIMGLITCVCVLPFAIPYLRLASEGQIARQLSELEIWSINPYDFFIPNLLNPILGKLAPWFQEQLRAGWQERGICLGIAATILGLVGWRQSRRLAWTSAIAAVWVASFLIALGPTLHWGGQQVHLPPFDFVPLPAYVLYRWLPLAGSMRVMSRFGLWTGLMTAAWAGWGAGWLIERIPRRQAHYARYATLGIVIAIILVESYGVLPRYLALLAIPQNSLF